MIEQGWEFNLGEDGVSYERLSHKKYRIILEYQEENFYYNTIPSNIDLLVNSIIVTVDENLDVPWDRVSIEIEYMNDESLSVILTDIFDLEEGDHMELLFYFDVDQREGIINNLLDKFK